MKRTRLAAVALLATVTLAACGDEQPEDSSGNEAATDLTSAPADAQWRSVKGIKVPFSQDCGPAVSADEVKTGYKQTPQCGVIAAINGQVALATTDDDHWPEMANKLLAPGEGKNQWAQARASQSIRGTVKNPAQFVGFKITDYSEDSMMVLLAVTWPDGKTTAQATQLAWQGDDWRLVLPSQDKAPDAVQLDNLDGFTEFRAEG